MKIIEFVGVPGSGKSTLCEILEKELSRKGFRVTNLNTLIPGDTLYQKVIRKINFFIIKYSVINRKTRRLLNAMDLPETSQRQEWIDNILILNYKIHFRTKNYEYVILDEGIIQFITSLFHEAKIENTKEIDKLIHSLCPEYTQNTKLIDLAVDLDIVCNRLLHRNREGDRFLHNDKLMMKRLLVRKRENITMVEDISGLTIEYVDGNLNSLEKLVLIIMDSIQKGFI